MAVNLDGDSPFRGLIGNYLGNLGAKGAPRIGDIINVKAGECVIAPPQGRLWYSPSWAKEYYQLHDLMQRPVFEAGDIFAIHPRDPIPLPPSGTELLKLRNPAAPSGATAAVVYKVVVPPALAAVLALPKPKPPTLQAYAIGDQPQPEPGQRWQVAYVDGRNLQRVVGSLVAA